MTWSVNIRSPLYVKRAQERLIITSKHSPFTALLSSSWSHFSLPTLWQRKSCSLFQIKNINFSWSSPAVSVRCCEGVYCLKWALQTYWTSLWQEDKHKGEDEVNNYFRLQQKPQKYIVKLVNNLHLYTILFFSGKAKYKFLVSWGGSYKFIKSFG